jgi:DNA-binding PadR family transcriptional regulator
MFSDLPPDTSGVYKVLKAMEEEGLVSANWELSDTGPAKRSYTLTKDGTACLKRWSDTLRNYQTQIEGLLAILEPAKHSASRGRNKKNCCQKES